jgi:hypothetical protein
VSSYRVTRNLPKPISDEIPSIEDLQGVVEKLRGDLKEWKDKPGTSFSDPEDELAERQRSAWSCPPPINSVDGPSTKLEPMLLTISTTHQPATDLGYLLHKNPARLQTEDLSFGTAYMVQSQRLLLNAARQPSWLR